MGIADTPTRAEGPRTRTKSTVQPTAVRGAAHRLWKNTAHSRNLDASFACPIPSHIGVGFCRFVRGVWCGRVPAVRFAVSRAAVERVGVPFWEGFSY